MRRYAPDPFSIFLRRVWLARLDCGHTLALASYPGRGGREKSGLVPLDTTVDLGMETRPIYIHS